MTKIISICVVKYSPTNPNADPIILSAGYDVDSYGFFQRDSIRQMCRFFTKTIVQRGKAGEPTEILESGHKIFLIKKGNGLAGTVVTDEDFPGRPAKLYYPRS